MGRLSNTSQNLDEKKVRTIHLLKSGRLGEARSILDELTKLAPEDPMVWIFSGYVSAALSQNQDAESSMQRAENLVKDDSLVWFNMGIVYKRMGNSGRAKSMFATATKIDKTLEEKSKQAQKEDYPNLLLIIPEHLKQLYDSVSMSDSDSPKVSTAPVVDHTEKFKQEEIDRLKKEKPGLALKKAEELVKQAKKILKKHGDSIPELEKALELILFARELRSDLSSAWAEHILILLALNQMDEAKEVIKKHKMHSRDLANYDWWRFSSVSHYQNAIALLSESNLSEFIPEVYDGAGKYLIKDLEILANDNQSDSQLWFPILMDAVRKQNRLTTLKACRILTSIFIRRPKDSQHFIPVAKYLLNQKLAWVLINEDTSIIEVYWDWSEKNRQIKEHEASYRGWAVLTRMFANAKQTELAKFCYGMSRIVGESPEFRKGSLGESQIKPIPPDAKLESPTAIIAAAIIDAIVWFGDGHPEYLADGIEQALKKMGITMGSGRDSQTTVICPRCQWRFTNFRPLTTRTLTIQCPRCFFSIEDPYK